MFSNESTAAQYEPVPGFDQDRTVSLIGRFMPKPVSNLTPEEAQALIDNGVNYIRPRAQSTAPDAVATAEPTVEQKKSDLQGENE